MKNELQRHKKSDSLKQILIVAAFVLAAVMITGVCLQFFGKGKLKPSNWFKPSDTETEVKRPIEDDNSDLHTHIYRATVVQPTCTEQGYTSYVCDCGESYKLDYTDSTHTYSSTVVQPTCTEQGYTLHACDVCGENYKSDYTEITPHVYWDSIVLPTCTERGYTLHTCVCGASEKDNFTKTISHECYEIGGKRICGVCGNYIDENGEIIGIDESTSSTLLVGDNNDGIVKNSSKANDIVIPANIEAISYNVITSGDKTHFSFDSDKNRIKCTINGTLIEDDGAELEFFISEGKYENAYECYSASNGWSRSETFLVLDYLFDKVDYCYFSIPESFLKSWHTYTVMAVAYREGYKFNPDIYFKSSYLQDTSDYEFYGFFYYTIELPRVELPPEPVKEGYNFLGWFYGTDESCKGNCVAYKDEPIYADTDLHAHFQIKTFNVTLNYYLKDSPTAKKIIVNWGDPVTLPDTFREGYDLVKWQYVDGTEYIDQLVISDISLSAVWKVSIFKVTFFVSGEIYSEKTLEYGSKFEKIEEQAGLQNLQITSIGSSSGTPITSISEFFVTEDIEVQVAMKKGVDKIKNTVKNSWFVIVLSVVGIIAFVAFVAALCTYKKKSYRR